MDGHAPDEQIAEELERISGGEWRYPVEYEPESELAHVVFVGGAICDAAMLLGLLRQIRTGAPDDVVWAALAQAQKAIWPPHLYHEAVTEGVMMTPDGPRRVLIRQDG